MAVAALLLAGCGDDDEAAQTTPAQISTERPERAGQVGPDREGPVTGPGTGEPGAVATVKMRDISYAPRELDIPTGYTVVWQNEDDIEHTVTKVGGPGSEFSSGRIPAESGTFKQEFSEPGTIEYRCEIHPDRMRGVIQVLEE